MHHHKVDFYEKYGEVIINLERKYGFKPVLHAADAINEFLYFKQNPELVKQIFEILGNSV